MTQRLNFDLELKGVGEAGEFTGLASVYGNVDLGGDMVERGAFAQTLAHKGNTRPLLWQHRTDEPIGVGKLEDGAEGLTIHGKLNLAVTRAREAYELLKQGAVRGLSIGYKVAKQRMDGDGRRLMALELFEVSLVTLPMNESALVTGVKTRQSLTTVREFEHFLKDSGFSRREAAAVALHGWKGLQDAGDDAEDDLPAWLRQTPA